MVQQNFHNGGFYLWFYSKYNNSTIIPVVKPSYFPLKCFSCGHHYFTTVKLLFLKLILVKDCGFSANT